MGNVGFDNKHTEEVQEKAFGSHLFFVGYL